MFRRVPPFFLKVEVGELYEACLGIGSRILILLNQKPRIGIEAGKGRGGGFKLFIYKYQACPLQLFPPWSHSYFKKSGVSESCTITYD